jgi:hypothetical protein
MAHLARRVFELLEPICLVTCFAEECGEELDELITALEPVSARLVAAGSK